MRRDVFEQREKGREERKPQVEERDEREEEDESIRGGGLRGHRDLNLKGLHFASLSATAD
jgi:hypothetical protein